MAKGMMIVDGQRVNFDGEKNVLSVIRKAGIEMPTFCYYSDLSVYGACRMCVVEDEKTGKIDASCSMEPRDGMRISTNSARLLKHRRVILELLLASHNCNCTTCEKSGHCRLQELAQQFGVRRIRFPDTREHYEIDSSSPAVLRDPNKCILCGDCVRVCEEMQGMGILNFAYRGSNLQVMPAFDRKLAETKCVSCGQCAAVCTTGAITVKNQIGEAWRAIHDPSKRVVIQIAPAVRVAVGEAFGFPAGENVLDKLVTALKLMGVDEVYDTTFGADFTTIAESEEFLERLKNGGPFPMFTSCCPGWVRFIKSQYPKYVSRLSTAKSPQQMFGAIAKSYYADLLGVDPNKIFCISVMPCLAKKHECALENMNDAGAGQDVDVVLTTREVDRLIRAEHIIPQDLKEEEFDTPLGAGTGAAVIFGTTGGVMEAALRSAYYLVTGKNPDPDAFYAVRGMEGWKEAKFDVAGTEISVAVAHGLGNTRRLMEAIERGDVHYDFVEIMACPGGCAGGGGQPIHEGKESAEERGENLRKLDRENALRFSHENPSVIKCYENYLQKPLSHRAHELLHTDHKAWLMPDEPQE